MIVDLERELASETADETIERVMRERRLSNLPAVAPDAPQTTRLPFGKHRGARICDLSPEYLRWLVREFRPYTNQEHILAAAVQELKNRAALAAQVQRGIPQ